MSATNAIERSAAPTTEQKGPAVSFEPAVDMVETADEYLLLVDMPGAAAEHVDVSFEDGVLTIHACVPERQCRTDRFICCEYGVGDYHREFRLGTDIDSGRIAATVTSGVLTLTLPKLATAKRRRIEISGS